jgi:hypothetical protein
MRTLKMKQPSVLGKGPLGQQTLGQRFAKTHYTNKTAVTHRPRKVALPSPDEFYTAEIEGLKEYSDGWAWGCCPFHADSNPSFTVNMESGAYRCMSSNCGAHGGSIVSFVSELHGLDWREALDFLGDWS